MTACCCNRSLDGRYPKTSQTSMQRDSQCAQKVRDIVSVGSNSARLSRLRQQMHGEAYCALGRLKLLDAVEQSSSSRMPFRRLLAVKCRAVWQDRAATALSYQIDTRLSVWKAGKLKETKRWPFLSWTEVSV